MKLGSTQRRFYGRPWPREENTGDGKAVTMMRGWCIYLTERRRPLPIRYNSNGLTRHTSLIHPEIYVEVTVGEIPGFERSHYLGLALVLSFVICLCK